MATVLELDDSPVVPQRRRREPVEIIDVDLFDDDANQRAQRSPRPAQRRRIASPELISLIDSDDDEPIASSSTSQPQQRRNRLISPPPRINNRNTVPPVPAVPPNFSRFTSHPRPRPRHPDVVRPIDQPFAFEANMAPAAGPSRRHSRHALPPPEAARPSHHIPAMGFGGALITNARAQAAQERQDRILAHQRRGLFGRAGAVATNALRMMYGADNRVNVLALGGHPHVPHYGHDDDAHDEMLAIQMLIAEGMDEAGSGFAPLHTHDGRTLFIRRRSPHRKTALEYKPAFTHPDPPESEFTFDFAPPEPSSPKISANNPIVIDDEDTPSSPTLKFNTVLICANCRSPLLCGGGGAKGGPEEERRRRVWGLRCGHMIDGQCLEKIAYPSVIPSDTKGKGKAKAVVDEGDESAPEDESIRARLRSRPAAASRAQPKRKRKAKAPRREAEHEWTCPVIGCCRVHVSVKVDGVWGVDKEQGRGAIAVFV